MSAHIAEYKGKPTAYLDQNILDLFVKGIAIDLAEALTQSFQIVFSDETMNHPAASSGVSRDNHFLSSQQAAGNLTRRD